MARSTARLNCARARPHLIPPGHSPSVCWRSPSRAAPRCSPFMARADLTRAIRLLGEVAVAPNDQRWDGIDMISLIEANALGAETARPWRQARA